MFIENKLSERNFIEINNSIEKLVNDKLKTVKENILKGEIKIPINFSKFREYKAADTNKILQGMSYDSFIVENIFNKYKLMFLKDRRKVLETKLNLFESNISKLKTRDKNDNNINSGFSPKIFSTKFVISPINNRKQPRTLKISDDIERKQKEIQAQVFVKNINKDKNLTLIREEERRKKLENKLISMYSKVYSNLPEQGQKNNSMINKETKYFTKKRKIKINNIKLPPINNKNSSRIENSSIFTMKEKTENQSKIKDEESNFRDHNSSRSIKKSLYYFNDPKLSRMLEIKNYIKYNPMNNRNLIDSHDDNKGCFNFIPTTSYYEELLFL